MPHQQNPEQLGFPVLAIHALKNRLDYLQPFVAEIVRLLNTRLDPGFYNIYSPKNTS